MKLLTRHEELALLTILRLKDEAYLVTIRDELKKSTGNDQSFGTLYVSLNRLKRNGYLSTHVGESTAKRGGKAIKYYRLTEQGVQALKAIKNLNESMWVDFTDMILDK